MNVVQLAGTITQLNGLTPRTVLERIQRYFPDRFQWGIAVHETSPSGFAHIHFAVHFNTRTFVNFRQMERTLGVWPHLRVIFNLVQWLIYMLKQFKNRQTDRHNWPAAFDGPGGGDDDDDGFGEGFFFMGEPDDQSELGFYIQHLVEPHASGRPIGQPQPAKRSMHVIVSELSEMIRSGASLESVQSKNAAVFSAKYNYFKQLHGDATARLKWLAIKESRIKWQPLAIKPLEGPEKHIAMVFNHFMAHKDDVNWKENKRTGLWITGGTNYHKTLVINGLSEFVVTYCIQQKLQTNWYDDLPDDTSMFECIWFDEPKKKWSIDDWNTILDKKMPFERKYKMPVVFSNQRFVIVTSNKLPHVVFGQELKEAGDFLTFDAMVKSRFFVVELDKPLSLFNGLWPAEPLHLDIPSVYDDHNTTASKSLMLYKTARAMAGTPSLEKLVTSGGRGRGVKRPIEEISSDPEDATPPTPRVMTPESYQEYFEDATPRKYARTQAYSSQ